MLAIEDRAAAADSAGDRYVCPTHPTVVRSGPGTCSECGQKLVLTSAAEQIE